MQAWPKAYLDEGHESPDAVYAMYGYGFTYIWGKPTASTIVRLATVERSSHATCIVTQWISYQEDGEIRCFFSRHPLPLYWFSHILCVCKFMKCKASHLSWHLPSCRRQYESLNLRPSTPRPTEYSWRSEFRKSLKQPNVSIGLRRDVCCDSLLPCFQVLHAVSDIFTTVDVPRRP